MVELDTVIEERTKARELGGVVAAAVVGVEDCGVERGDGTGEIGLVLEFVERGELLRGRCECGEDPGEKQGCDAHGGHPPYGVNGYVRELTVVPWREPANPP